VNEIFKLGGGISGLNLFPVSSIIFVKQVSVELVIVIRVHEREDTSSQGKQDNTRTEKVSIET